MDAIITQVQNLAKTVDEAGRKELIDALQTLQYSIETPNDTLQRFVGLGSDFSLTTKQITNFPRPSKSLPHELESIWVSSTRLITAKILSVLNS